MSTTPNLELVPLDELRDVAPNKHGVATLREQRMIRQTRIDRMVADLDKRAPKASEQRDFDKLCSEIDHLDAFITQATEPERRQKIADDANRALYGTEDRRRRGVESRIYNEDTSQQGTSFLLDLVRAQQGDLYARQRLEQYQTETRVNPNRVDGQGGYFVPPTWLVDQYVALARAGRPFADACVNLPLPRGTDSINIPKVNTGTAVAVQTADAAAVTFMDMTDTSVSSPVITLAGQQDVALQLLDQSPIAFDQVVFSDLSRALFTQVDVQTLSGTNANGQVNGVLNMSGSTTVTYTDATPTVPELWPFLLQAIDAVFAGVFMPATHMWMHPRRWFWLCSTLDNSNRPLVVPYAQGPFNAFGVQTGDASQSRPVGNIAGVDVWLDPNIPTNLGAGTNEDRIIVARQDQLYLWESDLRLRTLTEVLSGTLQVRLQAYEYAAFIGTRLPKAVSIIAGTGLIAPAGFN